MAKGQTLVTIARAHGVSAGELAKANKLDPAASLRIGQRLLLPGTKPSALLTAKPAKPSKAESRSGKPKRTGIVTFYRIWSQQTIRVKLVDDKGNVRPGALRQMRELMRPKESRKRKLPNERLMRLIAQVSDHFGGRPIHVVSGYRLPGGLTRDTSRHVAGEAIDFRIPGVAMEELRDHCQRFDHVGVGFYPRTQFVHLDVRRQNARWTDWSLPGQAPVLTKPEAVDNYGKPIPVEEVDESELQEAPPAPDDGQPPIDDAPRAAPGPVKNQLGLVPP